ncbi:hypothetical protein [Bradyrhizobium sp. JYMT SZCCT0428]|uniref:hypothetical protein n=1 Tax=Bradyrhizobium sp. JYMT SZCCT0428 TaxID=2807673 RepID=UPI001BAE507D|nr:hypothetical protein [Bradyrhizobium sp. JYMT SZCCT0428]MBR1149070.1 hypothetical protein [Bradyrhizobium sp. JYMT SZCCT0428]
MTKAVDRYFEIYDACIAAGGVLSEFAAAMVDTVVAGGSLETNGAGVVGRWRVEARQVLRRRRTTENAKLSGNCSEDARALRGALLRYAASNEFERAREDGTPPSGDHACLFLILSESRWRVPAVRTLRRRLKDAA